VLPESGQGLQIPGAVPWAMGPAGLGSGGNSPIDRLGLMVPFLFLKSISRFRSQDQSPNRAADLLQKTRASAVASKAAIGPGPDQ